MTYSEQWHTYISWFPSWRTSDADLRYFFEVGLNKSVGQALVWLAISDAVALRWRHFKGLYRFQWPIGDWKDISIAHVIIIIIKWEVSTFPIVIFVRGCVWDVCYIIFFYLLHIHSGKTGNLFSLSLCSLWWVQIFRYVLTWRSYSFICTLHQFTIIIVQAYLKTLKNACQI